jgi:hypothetical protein
MRRYVALTLVFTFLALTLVFASFRLPSQPPAPKSEQPEFQASSTLDDDLYSYNANQQHRDPKNCAHNYDYPLRQRLVWFGHPPHDLQSAEKGFFLQIWNIFGFFDLFHQLLQNRPRLLWSDPSTVGASGTWEPTWKSLSKLSQWVGEVGIGPGNLCPQWALRGH